MSNDGVVCTVAQLSIKDVPLLFFQSLRETLPILLVFGTRHHDETWRKWLQFNPTHRNTVATLPCEMHTGCLQQ